jgi:hypothetical protein
MKPPNPPAPPFPSYGADYVYECRLLDVPVNCSEVADFCIELMLNS